jgi:hypothetical protein
MRNQRHALKTATVLSGLATAAIVLLAGCATEIDCDVAGEAGFASGQAGEILTFDAARHHPECQIAYEEQWQRGHDLACDVNAAFERGLNGAAHPEACTDQSFLERFQLGQTLASLRAERARYEAELREAELIDPTDRRRIEGRLRVLAREIPELETLAQIRGLMPPADLPPELTDPQQ